VLFQNRLRAESFGAIAEAYDRVRPSYPQALIDALLEGGVQRVLDVGAGTGIASVQFAQRGCEVLGVEIDERMAARARAKGILVEVARFEDWDARGRRFDLVTSGQAWHWIDPRIGTAKAADALAPGGRIGLFWNRGELEPDLRELLAAAYRKLEPSLEEFFAVGPTSTHSEVDARAAIEACQRSGGRGSQLPLE